MYYLVVDQLMVDQLMVDQIFKNEIRTLKSLLFFQIRLDIKKINDLKKFLIPKPIGYKHSTNVQAILHEKPFYNHYKNKALSDGDHIFCF